MKKSDAIALARDLRKNQTESETILWKHLRNRGLNDLKFLRQGPIVYRILGSEDRYFIADFYCHQHMLIIEVDGDIHLSQRGYDIERTEVLEELGYTVVRFSNEDVKGDVSMVLRDIVSAVKTKE